MKVLVIGGGTGGLALAHGLKRAGIGVTVFERDVLRTDGLHGYRVGIDPDGSRALHALLPTELYDTFVATRRPRPEVLQHAHRGPQGGAVARPAAGHRPGGEREVDQPDDAAPGAADRAGGRGRVRQGVHPLRAARRRRHGVLRGRTQATGDLLVAADGLTRAYDASTCRRRRPEETGIIAIAGKLPLTEESAKLVPPKVFEGITMVNAPRGLRLHPARDGVPVGPRRERQERHRRQHRGADPALAGAAVRQHPRLHQLGPVGDRGQVAGERDGAARRVS